MSARTVPSAMPPSIATSVSCTEKISPLSTKLEKTDQSRKAKSRFMSMPSDHAGHLHLVFDEQGDAVDDEGRDEVQPGHGQVHLDTARGFFLRLHGEHGQFGD